MCELESEKPVTLPPMNGNGHYRFGDGSKIWPSGVRKGKWAASWADGTLLKHEDTDGITETVSYFDTPEEAAATLAACGEGPASA